MNLLPHEGHSLLKITVERSGGFAGIKRVWTAEAATPDEVKRWQPVVEACPWESLPARGPRNGAGQPDRFIYSIRAGQHRATVPEQALTGPWRTLVDLAKEAAKSPRPPDGR